MTRARQPMTREVILSAALKILDSEGLAALSMRRVATAVGVEAMSLYNHVKDKQDLLNGLADLVLSQITPPEPTRPWDRRLETIAIGLYDALVAHPALVVVLASEQGRPTDLKVLQGMDSILAALGESGLSPRRQVSAYRGLLALCLGFVLTHTLGLTATKSQALTAWAAWDADQWDRKTLPHLARLAPQFQKTHADDDFRFMLEAYLETLRRTARARGDRRRPMRRG